MREASVYNIRRALPRMSWHPRNLYNLWSRSLGAKAASIDFTNQQNRPTLFKQRWTAKALLRAYHGDYIKETIFKRWYLPQTLPDVRRQSGNPGAASLNKWAKREDAVAREAKRLEEEHQKGLAPVGSLMFTEIERRIDVLIFRACLAPSVYEARRLVIHGSVLLNGKKHTNPNTRLAPGDMFSVDPKAMKILQPRQEPKQVDEETGEKDEAAEEAYAESEATSEVLHSDAASATSEAELGGSQSEESPTSAADGKEESKSSKWKVTSKSKPGLTPFHLPPYASPFIFVPAYIEPSFTTCSAVYLRHPTARPGYSEIPTPYDADGELMRMAWEWYSKRRSRIRSKSQLARMPENRQ